MNVFVLKADGEKKAFKDVEILQSYMSYYFLALETSWNARKVIYECPSMDQLIELKGILTDNSDHQVIVYKVERDLPVVCGSLDLIEVVETL